jgi:hypothetical protein
MALKRPHPAPSSSIFSVSSWLLLIPIRYINGDFFNHITIIFEDWHLPYLEKHKVGMTFYMLTGCFD